jgi:hypothetical protein
MAIHRGSTILASSEAYPYPTLLMINTPNDGVPSTR